MRWLLIVSVLAIGASLLGLPPAIVFVLAFVGLVPLAGLLGEATEVLAEYLGPKIGALLNATFGNAIELLLLLALLRSGQVDLVKASIAGSILLALLLSVGMAELLAGLRHGVQKVKGEHGATGGPLMALAVIGLALPTMFAVVDSSQIGVKLKSTFETPELDEMSIGIATILFILYLLDLVYRFQHPGETAPHAVAVAEASHAPKWSKGRAFALLLAATAGAAVVSEVLSDSVEPFGELLGLTALFMGVIILPVAGNMSEMIVAMRLARNNQIDLALATVFDAAKQVALFVAPLLVFLGLFFGQMLTLYFNEFEVVALGLAVFISILLTRDTESNWMEGAMLLALYVILALWFFFLRTAS